MRQRQWKIQRVWVETQDATRRWDQVYQALLFKAAPPIVTSLQVKNNSSQVDEIEPGKLQEVYSENSYLCQGF